MSKIQFCLFLFCFPLLSHSQIESAKVTYTVNHKLEYISNTSDQKGISHVLNPVFDLINSLEYNLLYKDEQALFSVVNGLEIGDDETQYKMAKNIVGKGSYYINIPKRKKMIYRSLLGDNFIIEHPFEIKDWEVSEDSKIINGYKCYKANLFIPKDDVNVKDRHIEAWFTPEIPIPLGPKNYNGLDGLILSLTEGRITFTVKNVEFQTSEEIRIPRKGIKMTKQQFDNYIMEKSREMGFITK